MPTDVNMMDGAPIPVIVPSRYYTYASDGRRFSMTAMADFVAECGFGGIDVSLDSVGGAGESFGDAFASDGAWRSVLFSLGNRAAALGLSLPVCHLPFVMPDPDCEPAMARFARELRTGLEAAAFLGIPVAVTHPIVRHSSAVSYDAWLAQNLTFLAPLCDAAARLGVALAIENMAGKPYPGASGETVFGSRAEDVRCLADKLNTGICWDFGHAHLTGLCQSAELATVGDRLRMVHIHDNNGAVDRHLLPFDGTVDWDDAAEGLRAIGFSSMAWRCINLEIRSSHLPSDPATRAGHAARALDAARRLAGKI